MEKPEVTSLSLAACPISWVVGLAAIAGGALAYAACGMNQLDDIVGDAEAC